MKKICFLATNTFSIELFLKKIILRLSNDYKIIIICSEAQKLKNFFYNENLNLIDVKINRRINLVDDIFALIEIIKILKREKVDILHSIMPKTGFIGCIAAIIAGTKIRIHTFTGQVWCNYSYIKKFFFKKIDELIIYFNSHILVDSFSQKNFLESQLKHRNKLKVIGNGSIAGFDLGMFKKFRNLCTKKKIINILFVGRINKDKGIFDLIDAFKILNKKFKIKLTIGGILDDPDIKNFFLAKINSRNIIWVTNQSKIKKLFIESDLFCLPSYREGFGNSVIEANIAKLPVLITDIYGFGDIIKHKLYSRTCKPGNINDLKKNLEIIICRINEYKNKSKKNISKIDKLYNNKIIIREYLKFYKRISNDQICNK